MKLVACTLKNVETHIEIDPSETIEVLSQKIVSNLKDVESNKIRLIHSGKILKMEQRISDYIDIKEGDKIIVLVSKQSEATPVKPQPTIVPKTQETAPTVPTNTLEDSALLTGEELNKAIDNIVEMGFEPGIVREAMAAAYNNPARAIEILTNTDSDISNSDLNEAAAPLITTPALEELRCHPMFEHMRAIVRSNPQTLPQILSLIGQSDPAMLQAITENHEEFIQLLSEPTSDINENLEATQSITLTPEEMESITRLEGLGFSRPAAIEAFLACDKNEELAANYLFENVADYISDNDN